MRDRERFDALTRELLACRQSRIADRSGDSRTDTLRALDEVNTHRLVVGLPAIAAVEIEVYPGHLTEAL